MAWHRVLKFSVRAVALGPLVMPKAVKSGASASTVTGPTEDRNAALSRNICDAAKA
ncbi:MAG: hypothetical protein ACJAVS_001903 [Paracoccaceae bacterium]|jgi:hypothetical protein